MKRASGWSMPIIFGGFFLYAMVGHLLPGMFQTKEIRTGRLVSYLALDTASLLGQTVASDYEVIAAAWKQRSGLADAAFDTFFKASLNNGFVADTALPARSVGLVGGLSLTPPAPPTPPRVAMRTI